MTAPAVFFMNRRWTLPFDLRSAAVWILVSLFFLLGVMRAFYTSNWVFTILLVTMLLTILLVIFQLVFPFLIRGQRVRWEEFYSASMVEPGYVGQPGSALTIASLDAEKVSSGQHGEQVTAQASRGSLEKKTLLFNSLVHPQHPELGDLDHALLIGNTLVVIDSKRWRSGLYTNSMGNVLRDGEPFMGGTISLGHWVDLMASELDVSRVLGFVVMTNPSSIIGGSGKLSDNVQLITLASLGMFGAGLLALGAGALVVLLVGMEIGARIARFIHQSSIMRKAL